MFGELITFIDALKSVAIDFRSRQLSVERKEIISALLETYFYLKDATDEGEKLVEDAQPNPIEIIKSLNALDAKARLAQWDNALRRQTSRLMRISDKVFGQEFIDVVNPELRENLYAVMGSKFERATSLHGIGASLFFRDWVWEDGSDEDKARYISILAGEEEDLLQMDKIRSEIAELRGAMESYRIVVNELTTSEEILKLSQAARNSTLFPNEHNA